MSMSGPSSDPAASHPYSHTPTASSSTASGPSTPQPTLFAPRPQRPLVSRMHSSQRLPPPLRSKSTVEGPSTQTSHLNSTSTHTAAPPLSKQNSIPPFLRTPSSWHRRHPTSHDRRTQQSSQSHAYSPLSGYGHVHVQGQGYIQGTGQGHNAFPEPTTPTPSFDRSLASVLGSPFLTTSAPLPSPSLSSDPEVEIDIVDGAPFAVLRTDTITRPPSPVPSADYSIVSIPRRESAVFPQALLGHGLNGNFGRKERARSPVRALSPARLFGGGGATSSSSKNVSAYLSPAGQGQGQGYTAGPNPTNQFNSNSTVYGTATPSNSTSGPAFQPQAQSQSHNQNRKRHRAPSPSSSKARTLFPRLFGSIGLNSTLRASTLNSLGGSASQGQSGHKGKKRKHKPIPSFKAPNLPVSEDEDGTGRDERDEEPLDGEEGELVDEACFFFDQHPSSPCLSDNEHDLPHRRVSHAVSEESEPEPVVIDLITALPPELALRVLGSLDDKSLVRCAVVCKAWRALALDNLVWAGLFESRAGDGWAVDLSRAVPEKSGVQGMGGKKGSAGVGMERRPSERSLLGGTIARARKNSSLSIMSWRAARAASGVPTALKTMSEEREEGEVSVNWKRMYEHREILDRRWRDGEPEVRKIAGHTDSVYCLEFDGSRIITGSRDRSIKAWALDTGELVGTFEGHEGSVLCLKFERDWERTPKGREGGPGFMVSGSSDCSILVWDLKVGSGGAVSAEKRAELRGHSGGVLDLRMNEEYVVSCSKDALIQVWDRQTLQLRCTLRGHEGPVNAVGLELGRVVSASGDGKMILWDIASGARIRTFEGHDRGLACIEFKAGRIVSGSNDCRIKVWDAESGACERTLVGHTALVRALTFEPRSGRLVSAGYDRSVKVWDLKTGSMVREFKGQHSSHIFDVRFDARRIVSTSHDQKIAVFDFGKGLETSMFV